MLHDASNGQIDAPSASRRPFLTQVINGSDNYSFTYINPDSLPVYTSFAQDHWGYFNNQYNGTGFISNEGNPGYSVYPWATANRNAYPQYAQYGLMNQITFPTGGTDTIIYEGNVTSLGTIGGLRVAKVITRDGVTNVNQVRKIYYAPLNDLGNSTISGMSPGIILDKNVTYGRLCPPIPPANMPEFSSCVITQRSSSSLNTFNIYGGTHISYKYVTESLGGDNFENGGIEHWYYTQNNDYAYPILNGNAYDAPLYQNKVLNGREYYTRVFKKMEAIS